MRMDALYKSLTALILCVMAALSGFAQEVPIVEYGTNSNGQVQLEVNSSPNHYYILKVRHGADGPFELTTSMTFGSQGTTTTITEPLGSYPIEHYQVLEYLISSPFDTDLDGKDDVTEQLNLPQLCPLNSADSINIINGLVAIDSISTFNALSVTRDVVQWSEFLNGKGFVKYLIVDFNTDSPLIYYINSNTHTLHADFAAVMDIDFLGPDVKKGQVIYHPTSVSNNGTLGTFAWNYSNGHGDEFEVVQRTQELIAASMPFLKNNLSHFITDNNTDEYEADSLRYEDSRVSVLFESDVYAGVDYWGLNQAEGYGFFRQLDLEETPGPREIVLYESLPNSLPRVGGIISSVIQTPLSHVNLRAIQDNIPNAFIRDPLQNDSIADLLGHYVYYKVEQDKYTLREATIDEVNAWYENIRPSETQTPPLNLSYKDIIPLDEIDFEMYDGFGAKCANVSTMRTFGFPDGTIPNGFGIPFYFYQEFMEYNQFFEMAEELMNDPDFIEDRDVREEILEDFRELIEEAEMPEWMLNKLADMHASFPEGTSVRCRSSTNNEDLPGYSGAGLYESKTQHPSEGHISKSIKQVFASLWNLRAYEEREFYRVNHFLTAMGVLCHPNYSDEKVNGVGVSIDPVYSSVGTYYLNSQLGEDLITNPGSNSQPEELLLSKDPDGMDPILIVQRSNLATGDSLLMSAQQLDDMRYYMTVIHDTFEEIYGAEGNPTFAVDIEYKITSENQLIIKQARPWVSYVPTVGYQPNPEDAFNLQIFPNPASNDITLRCYKCDLSEVTIVNISGSKLKSIKIAETENPDTVISISDLAPGLYVISGYCQKDNKRYTDKFVKF